MSIENDRWKIYSCCKLVKGASRSIICDLQRSTFEFIPNSLYEILSNQEDLNSINEIKKRYDSEDQKTVDEYFSFLIDREFIFFTDFPERFPALSLDWFSPSKVSNCVIDVSKKHGNELLNFENIFSQLQCLNCKYIQLRFFDEFNLRKVAEILDKLECTNIVSVELILKYSTGLDIGDVDDFISKYARICSVVIYGHPCDKIYSLSKDIGGLLYIYYSSVQYLSERNCGIIIPSYFSINIQTFTEAQLHNTCLNRKIAIDVDGNIKNCPSMPHSYGNIKDTTLQEALEHPDFKKYWYIHKDQIEVCKDCEFRYICTDCRAYIEDPHNLYSKPLKCGYNPYTCEWEEWSTNPLKQKAIEYYGMQELVKDNETKA